MKRLMLALIGMGGWYAVTASAQQDREMQFAIEPQALTQALNELAQVAQLRLIGPASATRNLRSRELRGTFSPRAALERLLDGTSLTYDFVDSQTVAIHPRPDAPAPGWQTTGASDSRLRIAQLVSQSAGETAAAQRSSPATDRSSEELETVLVTAQRRTERLIDVPLSMSVLGVDEVERRGLVSREDYLRSIPSVAVRDDGVGLAEIVIRGAYGDSFRTGPTVGLYLGDVPLTGYAIGGSADIKLIDMQRVEVLRGPQGTLYG